ncbi:hypothetical protein [Pseudomonas phage PAXYB1]|uniref:Uncharacterized protein n=9 Tax=Viruses TaxID=10239 RepID=A0A0B4N5B6_9CAUD|nr:hypothetical protein PPLKD16_gp20 [Pseudomonas phage LKD16]YP_009151825.1 hypothetical protein ACQ50_gp25 [Pseudomonas phage vB_PaeP_PPA-ABTNL]YP_009800413.1 hypothetical protein HOT06_gp29 [Pseudomonas phage PAXYB1]QHZ59706.1 hypothetical protein vBPaePPE3_025 [Pseudomonas phage vB_PaeP_PE3]QYW08424.1 hypothetical protein vBPaeQDWS_24 [Pseudomonas phage vB_Pae_QDWS]UGL61493.1 hypothetical protein [Pseudomonas phage phipa2]WPH63186.1 hypothetical protein phagePAO1_30 [Pseudomonas phage vB_
MKELHPLHTPEFVKTFLDQTGCLPGERRTGRTTGIAMQAIGMALAHPRKTMTFDDHHGGSAAALVDRIETILEALGYRNVLVRPASRRSVSIVFKALPHASNA